MLYFSHKDSNSTMAAGAIRRSCKACGAEQDWKDGARFIDTPRGGRQGDVATTESETVTSHVGTFLSTQRTRPSRAARLSLSTRRAPR